jgi:hypothetical protein
MGTAHKAHFPIARISVSIYLLLLILNASGKSTHKTSFSRSTGETHKHYKLYSQLRRLYDQVTKY